MTKIQALLYNVQILIMDPLIFVKSLLLIACLFSPLYIFPIVSPLPHASLMSHITTCLPSAFIAEPKGEASNRDALSSPVCIYHYVCMYICISVPINPRHLDCAIARCSPQTITTTKCSTWPPSDTKLLNTPLHRCTLHSDCC